MIEFRQDARMDTPELSRSCAGGKWTNRIQRQDAKAPSRKEKGVEADHAIFAPSHLCVFALNSPDSQNSGNTEALEPPQPPEWRVAEYVRNMISLVFSLGLVMGAAGCTGGSSEPVSTVAEPSVPAVAEADGLQTLPPPSSLSDDIQYYPAGTEIPFPLPNTKRAMEVYEDAEAREAFRVLITPGSDSAAWEAAQKRLVDLGAGAIPVLLGGLESPHAIERETAATVCALTGSADARLQAALVKCLADEVSFVRANAAAALAQSPEHQPQVMATLTDLLADSDPQLRRMAAANLGSFGPEASTELLKLTAVLTDDDAEVVTPVIQLLGRIGPSALEAVPQLQKIAFEQDGELKQAAEQALLLIQSEGDRQ